MHSFEDDNELDQITRSAAEAYEAPSTDNWDMMQRVLDRELPQQKKRRFGLIWWTLPAILVLGLGIYLRNTNQKQPIQNALSTEIKSIKQIIPQPNIITEKKTDQIKQNLQSSISIKQPTLFNLNKEPSINLTKSTSAYREENKKQINNESELNKKPTTPSVNLTNTISNNEIEKSIPNIQNTNSDSTTTIKTAIKSTVEINTETNNKSVYINPKSKKGFFIGLVTGFDLSTVKYTYSSNVGYNFGGTIGYRFNNHWSVQTGGIYTQKSYKLKGQDFNPPKGSWISYYNIETVEGYCKMWEIPVIATYHFNSNKNRNTFLSFGSSSYFMKAENYNFLYNYNNQYYTRSSSYNSNDQHLFALLHISGGIENTIGKNISTILEPYAKIPISGVGFGSIQLSSFGLNFSVQYRQPKK